jgi:hypothetical protein
MGSDYQKVPGATVNNHNRATEAGGGAGAMIPMAFPFRSGIDSES